MSGLAGLNRSPAGVSIGLVQLQLPAVVTRSDLAAQTELICAMVGKARRSYPSMDLVVFPEYALHGLSMSTDPALMCGLQGPETAAFAEACRLHAIWGCFSIMEANPRGNPYNSGIIFDSEGELRLYYRKLHPWVPVEPWAPGDIGIPVCAGPNGSTLALIICHDGMFPEMARECAYKGADVILRTAGYTVPIRHSWQITNQANAFCNLAYTASVCLRGSDGTFDSMGEAMIVGFDGVPLVTGGAGPTRSWWGRSGPIWRGRHDVIGAWRTTPTSSAIGATWRSKAERATAPTHIWKTWSRASIASRGRTRWSTPTGHRAVFPARRRGIRPSSEPVLSRF